jgi:hypothetical protein
MAHISHAQLRSQNISDQEFADCALDYVGQDLLDSPSALTRTTSGGILGLLCWVSCGVKIFVYLVAAKADKYH